MDLAASAAKQLVTTLCRASKTLRNLQQGLTKCVNASFTQSH